MAKTFLFNLMREDLVYTNAANDRYSTNGKTQGFYNYTGWFNQCNVGYKLDKDQKVIGLSETRTVNL